MSTLEIVLIVEIVLLVAIVLVLLVAMMRRDRQYSRGSANQKNPGYGYGASTVFVDNGRGYPQQVYMGGSLNAPYANGQAVRMNNMQLYSGEEKTFFIPDGAHPEVSYASYPSQYDQRTVIHSVSGSGPQAARIPGRQRNSSVHRLSRHRIRRANLRILPGPENSRGGGSILWKCPPATRYPENSATFWWRDGGCRLPWSPADCI